MRSTRNDVLLYGISMAIVLLLLHWLESHFIYYNYKLDLFIGCLALLFTGLGVWLALQLVHPKKETVIIEKEIFVSQASPIEIDYLNIEKLGLSKREIEVLTSMSLGLSNEEIAQKLFVSVNTIKTHSSTIFVKLDVKRRTQAIEKAKRLNIIP